MNRYPSLIALTCLVTACFGCGDGGGGRTDDSADLRVPGALDRMLGGMALSLTGGTTPGLVRFDEAHRSTYDDVPFGNEPYNNGTISLTVGGTAFNKENLECIWAPFVDDLGYHYIGIASMKPYQSDDGRQRMTDHLVLIVPEADAVPGTTVDLDGRHSFAVFASGDLHVGPSVLAAAVDGTVTFDEATIFSDSLELISATIDAEFTEAALVNDVELVP